MPWKNVSRVIAQDCRLLRVVPIYYTEFVARDAGTIKVRVCGRGDGNVMRARVEVKGMPAVQRLLLI